MYANDKLKSQRNERINTKDLVTLGILNAVAIVLIFVISMFMGILPITYIFLPAVLALPVGVVYMLMLARVPKTGAFLVSGLVQGGVLLLMGSFWPMISVLVLASLLAELVVLTGSYKSFSRVALGYVLYVVGYAFGGFAPAVFMADYYMAYCTGCGYDAAYIGGVVSLVSLPVFLFILAITAVGAAIGALLGKKLLKKHFARAGIV